MNTSVENYEVQEIRYDDWDIDNARHVAYTKGMVHGVIATVVIFMVVATWIGWGIMQTVP